MSVRFCGFGDLGSGKTVSLVKEAVRYHWQYPENHVYSNIELFDVPFKPIDSAAVLFEINEPCFILLDELWHLADSRRSMSLINDVVSMLLLRSRKKDWRVGFTQQWFTQTDLRIRFITDVWISPDMVRGKFLHEELYDKHTTFLSERWYDGSLFFEDFDTSADPLTLNIDELKELWYRYRRDRGLIGNWEKHRMKVADEEEEEERREKGVMS